MKEYHINQEKLYPMKNKILSIILLFISFRIYSQSENASNFYHKGLIEKQNGSRLESLRFFEKAAYYNDSDIDIIRELASAYLDLRKYQLAAVQYKKLVEMGDETAANYKQLLVLTFNLKQYDDVLTYAAKLKKIEPSEKVSYYIGKVNYERDSYGEAIKNLNIAAKEDPQNAEVPYLIARSYTEMLNNKLAIPYFLKAIELNPAKNCWIYELGLIYYAIHDDKNALKFIIEAGEKGYIKDNDYLENLGISYLNAGKLDDGVAILGEILKKKPGDLNILNMIGEAYYDKGKYKEAIDYWDRVIFYDRVNAPALYMIGMSYQKSGEKEKGVSLCDKAISLDPTLTSLRQKKMNMGF